MPEIIEVEMYRRAATGVLGRRVQEVVAPDAWYVKGGASPGDVVAAVTGLRVTDLTRRGKLLVLVLRRPDGGLVDLGLRFGMTGRLVVDGSAPIDELLYTTKAPDPAYRRFALVFDGGGVLEMFDPRRLGGVELAPDVDALGPDAMTLTADELTAALDGARGPLKARLLDQARVAGIGNLLADEILWRAGLAPSFPAADLDDGQMVRLARTVTETIAELLERGGSHTGDLQEERHREGCCPRDGTPLCRETVGGRTSYWCPAHQLSVPSAR